MAERVQEQFRRTAEIEPALRQQYLKAARTVWSEEALARRAVEGMLHTYRTLSAIEETSTHTHDVTLGGNRSQRSWRAHFAYRKPKSGSPRVPQLPRSGKHPEHRAKLCGGLSRTANAQLVNPRSPPLTLMRLI